MANPWMKTHIQTDNGTIVEGLLLLYCHPARATDIRPFMGNGSATVEKGYIRLENRFNPQAPMYISLRK